MTLLIAVFLMIENNISLHWLWAVVPIWLLHIVWWAAIADHGKER